MESKVLSINFRGVDMLTKAIGGNWRVKVGVLANKNPRFKIGSLKKGGGHRVSKGEGASLSNADIAALHELGSPSKKIPVRSFLRMPIRTHFKSILDETKKAVQSRVSKGKELKPGEIFRFLGIACENVVQKAFETRGFGQWKPISKKTAERKGTDAILIDSAQLRRSITSKAEEA